MNTESRKFYLPSYQEIPDVGLYLEQVAKFINSYLQGYEELYVTPSMISNYAKQKLIERVRKKTYTRDQIAALIFINLAKNVISIEHTAMFLHSMHEPEQFRAAYEQFRILLPEALKMLHVGSGPVTSDNTAEPLLQRISEAIAYKMYLETCFDRMKTEEDD
ncbi:MAG: DUF1836 domain-containing protein [Solobacterium sp.]|nr:DUF1836 domain-containing protein [Solobacterium sp.]